MLGAERRIMISPDEQRAHRLPRVAATRCSACSPPGADPVRKVSIVPRGQALGVTLPDARRRPLRLLDRATCAAASSARSAAGPPRSSSTATSPPAPSPTSSRSPPSPGRWSGAGACRTEDRPGLRAPAAGAGAVRRSTARARRRRPRELVDAEVRRIVDECYAEAVETLSTHRDSSTRLRSALLERETLDEADAYAAAGLPRPAHDADEPLRSSANARIAEPRRSRDRRNASGLMNVTDSTDGAIDPREPSGRLLRDLRSRPEGLSQREAERRLVAYGANELQRTAKRAWWREVVRQLTHPLAMLLTAAALLAWASGSPAVAAAIVAVIAANATFAFVQEQEAERAVEALAAYLPQRATVTRDGARRSIRRGSSFRATS